MCSLECIDSMAIYMLMGVEKKFSLRPSLFSHTKYEVFSSYQTFLFYLRNTFLHHFRI